MMLKLVLFYIEFIYNIYLMSNILFFYYIYLYISSNVNRFGKIVLFLGEDAFNNCCCCSW